MEKNNPHKNHRARMRETYLKHGLDAFSDVEKLEFLLFFLQQVYLTSFTLPPLL